MQASVQISVAVSVGEYVPPSEAHGVISLDAMVAEIRSFVAKLATGAAIDIDSTARATDAGCSFTTSTIEHRPSGDRTLRLSISFGEPAISDDLRAGIDRANAIAATPTA